VAGAFQFNLVISTKEQLLVSEERLLAVLRWMLLKMPTTKRWYPVLERYIDQIAGRVGGFGGNPGAIEPSPTGDVPGLPQPKLGPAPGVGEIEHCGKIEGIVYDHFGDFAGFILEDEAGRCHRFESREVPMLELVHHAWIERTRVAVLAERHRPHVALSVILRAGGPRVIADRDEA
jgi:hypothetical protein